VLANLVQRLVHQQDAAGEARRRDDLLLEVEDLVAELFGGHAHVRVDQVELVLELDQRVVAAARGNGLGDPARSNLAAETQQVVPDDLGARLGDRKGDADGRSLDTVTVVDQPRRSRHLARGVVDPLRRRGAAAGRIHRHPEGFRVGLEHCRVPRRELPAVRGEIGRRDRHGDGVGRVRVRVVHPRLVAGRRRGDAAIPRWNGAAGVAGALGADRRQVAPEPCDLLRGRGAEGACARRA
jgi:hypothetical protein